jgi:hypothetical protein
MLSYERGYQGKRLCTRRYWVFKGAEVLVTESCIRVFFFKGGAGG